MLLHQVWMRRDDSDVKSVASALRGRDHSAKAVDSVGGRLFDIQKINRVRIAELTVIRGADIGLNSNMSGLNRPQEYVCGYLEFIPNEKRGSPGLRCFDRFNSDVGPVQARAMFPVS